MQNLILNHIGFLDHHAISKHLKDHGTFRFKLENSYFTSSQVPNISSMPNKWLQVFYYVSLVVPSLDFMIEVKWSQKLIVPSVPFIENVDIS